MPGKCKKKAGKVSVILDKIDNKMINSLGRCKNFKLVDT